MDMVTTQSEPVESLVENFCPKHEVDSLAQFAQPILGLPQFQKILQFSLTSSSGNDLFDGTGSLYNYEKNEFTSTTDQFNKLNSQFVGSQFEVLLNKVQAEAAKFGVKIGRSRWMRLNPKTCLSLHWDPDEFRFHIPLKTNNKCFFVVEDRCYRMPEVGSLYLLRTTQLHTAVNASFELRDHLVFDTYK